MEEYYIQALPPAQEIDRMLYFDGAGDYAESSASPFYNFGFSNFTLVLKATSMAYDCIVLSKGSGSGSAGYRIRFMEVMDLANAFYLIAPTGQQYYFGFPKAMIHTDDLVLIMRVGTNDAPSTDAALWPNSNRNPVNYHLYLNGVKTAWKSYTVNINGANSPFTEMVTSNFDSSGALNIGRLSGLTSLYHQGLVDTAAIYNRALTQTEIDNIQAGIYTPDALLGLWQISERTGRTLKDSSSVGNTFALVNYTDYEVGIPDPTTNRVYVGARGFFRIPPGTSNGVYSFQAPSDITVSGVKLMLTGLIGSWRHLRSGAVVASGQFTFGSGYAALSAAMLKGDTMEYTLTNGNSLNAYIGTFYNQA